MEVLHKVRYLRRTKMSSKKKNAQKNRLYVCEKFYRYRVKFYSNRVTWCHGCGAYIIDWQVVPIDWWLKIIGLLTLEAVPINCLRC